jgi:hypothetical protein
VARRTDRRAKCALFAQDPVDSAPYRAARRRASEYATLGGVDLKGQGPAWGAHWKGEVRRSRSKEWRTPVPRPAGNSDGQYATNDIGTEPYDYWSVRAVSRVVKIQGALRVQVDVTRIEDVRGHVLARNASPVNSGTASYAIQVSPFADVQPLTSSYGLCGGDCCADVTTRTPFRVRTLFSIRWSDGTLGRVARVGPWTKSEWCEHVASTG